MVPYMMLDKAAPLPVAFAAAGMSWATWPVGIGAVCALTASLLGKSTLSYLVLSNF